MGKWINAFKNPAEILGNSFQKEIPKQGTVKTVKTSQDIRGELLTLVEQIESQWNWGNTQPIENLIGQCEQIIGDNEDVFDEAELARLADGFKTTRWEAIEFLKKAS